MGLKKMESDVPVTYKPISWPGPFLIVYTDEETCRECNGFGKVESLVDGRQVRCFACNGAGKMKKECMVVSEGVLDAMEADE